MSSADDRIPVSNPTSSPFSMVVDLDGKWESLPFNLGAVDGSGILVSPRHVLTAGHTVFTDIFSLWIEADEVTVLPGRFGNNALGVHNVEKIDYIRNYDQTHDDADDIALLTLDNSVNSATGVAGLGYFTNPEDAKSVVFTSAGYPNDLQPETMYSISGMLDVVRSSDGRFSGSDTFDAQDGQSGSGVWDAIFATNPHVFGVITQAGPNDFVSGAEGLLLKEQDFNEIMSIIEQDLGGLNADIENRIIGSNEGDRIRGSYRRDLITGEGGDDLLYGGAGNDTLDGGAGLDTANYSYSPANALINLNANTVLDGWGDTDTLVSIETAIGTRFDDTFISGDGINVFRGGGGNDTYILSAETSALGIVETSSGVNTLVAAGATPDVTDGIELGRDGVLVTPGGQVVFIPGGMNFNNVDNVNTGGPTIPIEEYFKDDPNDPLPSPFDPSQPIHPDVLNLIPLVRSATEQVSPLVLDLDTDGIELSALQPSSVSFFDLDADGFAEQTGWVTGGDGFLALDWNQNGAIDNIGELFGSVDIDGFTLLSELDSDADGVMSDDDALWSDLLIWQDGNGDGQSDNSELFSLTDFNITAINLNATEVSQTIAGNTVRYTGTYTIDDGGGPEQRTVVDAYFSLDNANTYFVGDFVFNPEVVTLPNLRGYGELPNLFIGMSQDETLLPMVSDLSVKSFPDYALSSADLAWYKK